jgi:hypothetical protein
MVNCQAHRMQTVQIDVNLALTDVASRSADRDKLVTRNANVASGSPLMVLLGIGPAAPQAATFLAIPTTASVSGRHKAAAI